MNRRQFFKRAAIVAAGAAATPLVGKAPGALEAAAGTAPVSTADSLAWANRTAHSSPSRVPSDYTLSLSNQSRTTSEASYILLTDTPTFTFVANTDTGYYRIDQRTVGYAVNGQKAYEWYEDDGGAWKERYVRELVPHIKRELDRRA